MKTRIEHARNPFANREHNTGVTTSVPLLQGWFPSDPDTLWANQPRHAIICLYGSFYSGIELTVCSGVMVEALARCLHYEVVRPCATLIFDDFRHPVDAVLDTFLTCRILPLTLGRWFDSPFVYRRCKRWAGVSGRLSVNLLGIIDAINHALTHLTLRLCSGSR